MEYTFETHNGGISEDDSLIAEGQVLYSANMDLTSSYDFITTSKLPTNLFTHTSNIESMGWENDFPLFGGSNKEVFAYGNKVWDAPHDILKFWSNSVYLFMLDASEDISRIKLSDMHNSDWSTYTETAYTTFDSTSSNMHIVTQEEHTFIGYDAKIYKISNNATTWDSTILLNTYEFPYNQIVGMTEVSGSVRIYQENGDLLLWNKTDTFFSEKVPLSIRIQSVSQVANIDYLIAEGVPYYLDGFTLVPLIQNFYSDFITNDKLKIKNGSGENVADFSKGIFYLLGQDQSKIKNESGDVDFSYDDFILTYGTKKKFFPKALNLFLQTASSGLKYNSLYGLMMATRSYSSIGDKLYISYHDGVEYGVDSVSMSLGDYQTNKLGCVVYTPFDGGNKNRRKKLTGITIHAEIGNDSDKIEVYYLEGNILKPITGDITSSTIENKQKRANFRLKSIGKEFYEIAIGVVIKQANNRARQDSVKLYSITYHYEDSER